MWAGFFAIVLVMLAIDLFVVGGGKEHRVSFREAATWSCICIGVSLTFAGALWWYLDGAFGREIANQKALEYVTGYLIEKSLAVDNVFVWLILFSFFAIPLELQKRVLVLGVLGAIVMRTIMIFAGVWLITQFHWLLYVFAAFLIATAVKMLVAKDSHGDPSRSGFVRLVKRWFPVTTDYHGQQFLVRASVAGRSSAWALTPLALALIMVEGADLVFAIDSIPAIFAITGDPFLVFTSNVFAMLGLRSLYFALAGIVDKFRYLKPAMAIVLLLVGGKMLAAEWLKEMLGSHFNLYLLATVASVIASGILLSLAADRWDQARDDETAAAIPRLVPLWLPRNDPPT